MNVLVTGAAGFIGNKIAKCFFYKGYNVCGWDRCYSKDIIPIINVDLCNKKEVLDSLSIFKPDIVIHCAGSADVSKSVQFPEIDYEGNVTVTHNLLFSLHYLGLIDTRVVFLSSAGVYGNPKILPIIEDSNLNPLSPYAVHKVMSEELCKYFVSNYGMDIKVARIFSAYGSGLKKQIFWDMYNKYISTGRLDMYGTGNESRDYIHINDVVQALFLLSTTDSSEYIFNIANGEEVLIKNVAELFADALGISISQITYNGVVREGDPLNWCANIDKIKNLGYSKSISLSEGILDYVRWVEKNS